MKNLIVYLPLFAVFSLNLNWALAQTHSAESESAIEFGSAGSWCDLTAAISIMEQQVISKKKIKEAWHPQNAVNYMIKAVTRLDKNFEVVDFDSDGAIIMNIVILLRSD